MTPATAIEQRDFVRGLVRYASSLPDFRRLERAFMSVRIPIGTRGCENTVEESQHYSSDRRYPFGWVIAQRVVSRAGYDDMNLRVSCKQTKKPYTLEYSASLNVDVPSGYLTGNTYSFTLPLHDATYDFDKAMAEAKQGIREMVHEVWTKRSKLFEDA